MTEFEKMVSGRLYDPNLDSSCQPIALKARKLCQLYNSVPADDFDRRAAILKELVPSQGKNLYLQGPIQFDYGVNTTFGDNCYANFNLVILDCAPVRIGNDVFMGTGVSLLTPVHPFLPSERNQRGNGAGVLSDREYAKPIEIGSNCWIASNVTVIGGVKIGDGCVIGAGSVVTRDIPSGCLAAGNPCRVIRKIGPEDSVYLQKELF